MEDSKQSGTSNYKYHAFRACMFAESLNMNAICHGAPAPNHVAFKLRVREYIAILYYWFFD